MPAATTVTTRSTKDCTVTTLAGNALELQTEIEAKFYNEAKERYLSENTFTVASDLRALDRLIFFETLVYRWTYALASGITSDGDYLNAGQSDQLRKNLKETAPMIAQIQNDLGLTKSQRQQEQAESIGAYIKQLKIAAKQHGVRREKQLGKAIELTKELFSLCGTYQRSNEAERLKLGFESADDIVEWVMGHMKPEFDAVDEHFRAHQQRFWIRDL